MRRRRGREGGREGEEEICRARQRVRARSTQLLIIFSSFLLFDRCHLLLLYHLGAESTQLKQIIQLLFYIKQIIQLLFNSSLRSVFSPSSPENCLPLPPPSSSPLSPAFFFLLGVCRACMAITTKCRWWRGVWGRGGGGHGPSPGALVSHGQWSRGGRGGSRSEKMAEALVAVVKEHAQMKVVFLVCKFF